MLKPFVAEPLTELDREVFDTLVSADHYLRGVLSLIDFESFRTRFASCYHPSLGRPALDPVLMLKLQFLQFHYNLSDRTVIAQAQVNVAFRFFLGLSLHSPLPDPSLLSVFRTRLGQDHYDEIFHDVLGQARKMGLVKDRLRLKDATHVIANIAIPSTIGLVAQARDRLLRAVSPFDPDWGELQKQQIETIRTASSDLPDEQRLLMRVNHLREMVPHAVALLGRLQQDSSTDAKLLSRLEVAVQTGQHLLADQADPQKSDRLVSGEDPDARCGNHHGFFRGYQVDITEDADSELITGVHVLPGNGDEAADATSLIEEEEKRHGNDVEELSIDKAGFRGDLLREWQDPEGLNLEVTVPAKEEPEPTGKFTPEQFTLETGENGKPQLRCPGGQTTQTSERNTNGTGTKFRFALKVCEQCELKDQCLGECQEGKCRRTGRSVIKNDYDEEYKAARQRAETEKHKKTRKEHPRVERKLAEIVNRHGGRRARYRGRSKVSIQFLLTATVINIKRIVRLVGNVCPIPVLAGA